MTAIERPGTWTRLAHDPADWFSPHQIDRARRYQKPLTRLRVMRMVLQLVVILVFAFTETGPRLAEALGVDGWVLELVVIAVALELIGVVYDLPLDAWVDLRHDRAWGVSTQTGRGLMVDSVKSLGLGIVLNLVLLIPLWWLLRSTDLWWLWGWLVMVSFTVLLGFLYPVLIAPVFNKFTPLGEPEMVERLGAVIDRAGAEVDEVSVADASRRSRRDNAYVAGMGATQQVVVFDTLLEHPPEVVEQVVAHELGHWKLRHILKQIPVSAAMTLVMFLFLRAIAGWDWLLDQVGATSIGDPASLPIVLLAAGAAFSVVGMVGAFVSRAFERQADQYGLDLLREPERMMDMHRRLHVKNLADLTPSRWRYLQATHPPAAERLAFAHQWARAEGFDPADPVPVTVDVELTGSS